MNREYPFISALLVTYNESRYIERSLKSLIFQNYPHDLFEIIIIDGGSTDDTLSLAKALIQILSEKNVKIPKIAFFNNPKKILAAGWNIGIKNAIGDYVIRLDAHAEAPPNFLRLSVETILNTKTVCVGGKLITKTIDEKGKMITYVLSSPFGVGNSLFRVSAKAGYADTAVYGLYTKDIFEKVGYFDESLLRNQDIELHSRIREYGGKFYFNPDIATFYYSRDTIKKMLSQAYLNGLWNMIILKKKMTKLSIRYFVPLLFFLFLVLSTFGGFFFNQIWLLEILVIVVYFTLALVASLNKTKKITQVVLLPLLFFIFHMTYGVGSLYGFILNIPVIRRNKK